MRTGLPLESDVEDHLASRLIHEGDTANGPTAWLDRLQPCVTRCAVGIERRGAVHTQSIRAWGVRTLEWHDFERGHAEGVRRGARAKREDDLRVARLNEAKLCFRADLTTACPSTRLRQLWGRRRCARGPEQKECERRPHLDPRHLGFRVFRF